MSVQSSEPSAAQVTQLLISMRDGDATSREKLLEHIYGEMRGISGKLMRNERPNHTLGPTGLIHEAYLKLFAIDGAPTIENRKALFGMMVRAMHRILIDYSRYRNAQVRGAGAVQSLDVDVTAGSPLDEWMEELQKEYDFEKATASLDELAKQSPDHYATFVLKHYCGWKREQIAEALDCSLPSVDRYWTAARVYLRSKIRREDDSE